MVGKLRNTSDRSNASAMSMLPGAVNKEYFWACELTSDKASKKWHIPSDDMDDEDYIEHTLVIRSVCLGAGAVEKEENVVVMESVGEDGEVFSGTIANLTKGLNPMVGGLALTADGKSGVTFTLVEGSGPISICGNHLLDYPEDDDDLDASQTDDSCLNDTGDLDEKMEDEEEDEEDEEEDSIMEEKTKAKQPAKRKAPAAKAGKGKKAKMEEEDEDEDDDEDDEEEDEDEEEEESEEDVKVKKAKKDAGKPAAAKGKPKAAPMKNGKAAKKVKK